MKFFLHPALKRFKRKTAVILPKDIGTIIALTALSKEDEVVEIGGGSGYLTFYLARIAKHVYVYERREDIFEILQHNLKDFENVSLFNKDGKEATQTAYLYIIDSPDFLEVLPTAAKHAQKIVLYLPNANQAREASIWLQKEGWDVAVVRTILEEWQMDEKRLRPKHKQLIHTAFLVFGSRK
ncbi:MAG: methyltransferase [Candidatus Micrarchaeota archaeon]|nr:methyltransferase [Candidatus Micrarchaeota archaeon]